MASLFPRTGTEMAQDFNDSVTISTDENRRTNLTGKSIWIGRKLLVQHDALGLPLPDAFNEDSIVGLATDGTTSQPPGASLIIGTKEEAGAIFVQDSSGETATAIWAGSVHLGRSGQEGSLWLRDETGQPNIRLQGGDAQIVLGGLGKAGAIELHNRRGDLSVRIDGESGDITFTGADCAEEFELADRDHTADAGTVMIIGEDGRLEPSSLPYDTRVAGVISGAGDYRPGLVLGHKPGSGRISVGLAGRVYCKVDATEAPVKVGDLLTTSREHGHAMKASDRHLAFGAVLGKALSALPNGRGVIPVLIALN